MNKKISALLVSLILSQSVFAFEDPYKNVINDKNEKPLLNVNKDELAFQKSLVRRNANEFNRDVYYITEDEARKDFELTAKSKQWESDLILNDFFFSEDEINKVQQNLKHKYLTEFSYHNKSADLLGKELSKYSLLISEHNLKTEFEKEKNESAKVLRDKIKDHLTEIEKIEERKRGFEKDASSFLKKGFAIDKQAKQSESNIDNSSKKIYFKIDEYLKRTNERSRIKLSDLSDVVYEENKCDTEGYVNSNKRNVSYSIQINDVLCLKHTFFRKLSLDASNALMSTKGFEQMLDTHSYILARDMQILGKWDLRKQRVKYPNVKEEIKKLREDNKEELRILSKKYDGNYETLNRQVSKHKDWIVQLEQKIKEHNDLFDKKKEQVYINIANRYFKEKNDLKNAIQKSLEEERELLYLNDHQKITNGKYKHIIVKKTKPIVVIIDSSKKDKYKESYVLNMKWAELSQPYTSSNKFKAISINKLKYASIDIADIQERNLGHDYVEIENNEIIKTLIYKDIIDSYQMLDKIKDLNSVSIKEYYK